MGEKTGIAWTDSTWNPWRGCHKISEGCKNCYMFREQSRYGHDPNKVVRCSPSVFNAPLHWTKPAKVFTCSWSDWFIDEADSWRNDAWEIIRKTPHLTYQILTKRVGDIKYCLPDDWGSGWDNVWLGVTIENTNQRWRADALCDIPAKVRFVSYEPALSKLDLFFYPLDWIICGGESGIGCRPMDIEWARYMCVQCKANNVPFFMKQLGGYPNPRHSLEDFPEDLRIREFPI
jgi:protein gp37